jgi:predicted nuclease of predicted toxin-antitoxin system
MRILIDECLPKKFKRELVGHTVFMVQEKGWSSLKNGELLRVAEKEFDVLITANQNLEHQAATKIVRKCTLRD